MRFILLLVVFASLLALGPTCQHTPRDTGLALIISDIPCDTVWEKVLQELKRLNLTVKRADPEKGRIEIGPVQNEPLAGDAFKKVEEEYQLELKCRDPLTTRITCQTRVKGLTADNAWVPLKEVDRYQGRFLDNLKVR
jgi:hypothetical protein